MTELSPAFVLHQRAFRESSLLLDVFTQQQGRLRLVAKGIRQSRRRGQHGCQLFQPLLMSWRGRSELQTLTTFERAGPAFSLHGHASLCGLYLNELVLRLLPAGEPETTIFAAYQQALVGLQQGDSNEQVLRMFEKQLLEALGYGLNLHTESATHQPIMAEQFYYYRQGQGLLSCDAEHQDAIPGQYLQWFAADRPLPAEALKPLKRLMREVIDELLDGRPLQSRQLFQQMQHYMRV